MLADPVTPDREGMLRVPDAPGLGVELDEEAVAFHALDGRKVGAR
jgi:L-alanine-DL-glutamate epimerase-like enolase superfamily enzyme